MRIFFPPKSEDNQNGSVNMSVGGCPFCLQSPAAWPVSVCLFMNLLYCLLWWWLHSVQRFPLGHPMLRGRAAVFFSHVQWGFLYKTHGKQSHNAVLGCLLFLGWAAEVLVFWRTLSLTRAWPSDRLMQKHRLESSMVGAWASCERDFEKRNHENEVVSKSESHWVNS